MEKSYNLFDLKKYNTNFLIFNYSFKKLVLSAGKTNNKRNNELRNGKNI